MILTAAVWIFVFLLFVVIVLHYKANAKKSETELESKKEFIDKYLFIVKFPSQFYVFPYVWGTKQTKVFLCTNDPFSGATPTFAIVDVEEAKRRITLEHHASMEELDRMGV